MTLKALFTIPIAVILLVTLLLAGMIVSREWADHQRGSIAIAAATRASSLTRLESQLTVERNVTWRAFEAAFPLPEPVARQLAAARAETDQAIAAMIAISRIDTNGMANAPESFLIAVEAGIASGRSQTDALLKIDRPLRTYEAFTGVMPRMLGPALLFGPQLARAGADIIRSEPELAGIIAVARIGLALREQLAGVAAVMQPRLNAGQELTETDIEKVRLLLALADMTTNLLQTTFYLTNPSDEMRALLAQAAAAREIALRGHLNEMLVSGERDRQTGQPIVWSSGPLAVWADQVNLLRQAIIREPMERARAEQASRTTRLNLALGAVGAITVIIAAALTMLHRSVVSPLAYLGHAITRIADGDRSTELTVGSATREIATMVKAVETLRQAALVADATARSQHDEEERRLRVLREVLGILRGVPEPSHMLERDVARLWEGIENTIAFLSTITVSPPPALETAASAMRAGLPEMRDAARDLDVIIAAADQAGEDALPEDEIMARILSVRAPVDRRDELLRTFIQPCLVALRDTTPLANGGAARTLHDLIGEQFQLIESTVSTMASVTATVARAIAIARGLPAPGTRTTV